MHPQHQSQKMTHLVNTLYEDLVNVRDTSHFTSHPLSLVLYVMSNAPMHPWMGKLAPSPLAAIFGQSIHARQNAGGSAIVGVPQIAGKAALQAVKVRKEQDGDDNMAVSPAKITRENTVVPPPAPPPSFFFIKRTQDQDDMTFPIDGMLGDRKVLLDLIIEASGSTVDEEMQSGLLDVNSVRMAYYKQLTAGHKQNYTWTGIYSELQFVALDQARSAPPTAMTVHLDTAPASLHPPLSACLSLPPHRRSPLMHMTHMHLKPYPPTIKVQMMLSKDLRPFVNPRRPDRYITPVRCNTPLLSHTSPTLPIRDTHCASPPHTPHVALSAWSSTCQSPSP